MTDIIFKILTEEQWAVLKTTGAFLGAPVDLADGYIHFSYEGQLAETAKKYFVGQRGLWIVAVDTTLLGNALRAEPSRGGALFPHLYAPLSGDVVLWATPLVWRPDGEPEWQPPDQG